MIAAERSGLVCEVCGRARATNVHHRKGRQIWDPWRPSNLLHLCGSGTTGCHGAITEHRVPDYERGWSIRRTGRAEPEQVPVQVCLFGDPVFVLLDNLGGRTPVPHGPKGVAA